MQEGYAVTILSLCSSQWKDRAGFGTTASASATKRVLQNNVTRIMSHYLRVDNTEFSVGLEHLTVNNFNRMYITLHWNFL